MSSRWLMLVILPLTLRCASLAVAQPTGVVISQWDFNDPSRLDASQLPRPSTGAGSMLLSGGVTISQPSVWYTGSGSSDPIQPGRALGLTSYPFQGSSSGTAGPVFLVSTAGYSRIVLSFDTQNSATASRTTRLDYSLDASTWITGPVFTATTTSFTGNTGRTLDLTSVAGAADNPNFRFRIVTIFDPAAASSGANPNAPYSANTRYPGTTNVYASTMVATFDMVTVRGVKSDGSPMGIGWSSTGSSAPTSEAASAGGAARGGVGIALNVQTIRALTGASIASVTADLSAIGGDPNQSFSTGGNGVFTFAANVAPTATTGLKSLPVTITDALGAQGTASIPLWVSDASVGAGNVVIATAYPGGGLSGAAYQSPFVELFNRTPFAIDLRGWALHAVGGTGSFTLGGQTVLSGTLPANGSFLVALGSLGSGGTLVGAALPSGSAPDQTNPAAVALSNSSSRFALTSIAAIPGACDDSSIMDLIAHGSSQACSESSPLVGTITGVKMIARADSGCTDTNHNAADLAIVNTAAPRNSSTLHASCFGPGPTGTDTASSPDPVCAGELLSLSVSVSPGTSPVSTGLLVTANLSALSGPAAQPLTDVGSGTWSLDYLTPAEAAGGHYVLPLHIIDSQLRESSVGVGVNIKRCNDPPPACKPNIVSGNGCLGPIDLLGFLNMYFINYDGHGSGIPGDELTLPQINPTSTLYAVTCSAAQQSVVPPIVTAAGLKADYDGDCQIATTDLLGFLSDYFNPASECFSGCFAAATAPRLHEVIRSPTVHIIESIGATKR